MMIPMEALLVPNMMRATFERHGIAITKINFIPCGKFMMEGIDCNGCFKREVSVVFEVKPVNCKI